MRPPKRAQAAVSADAKDGQNKRSRRIRDVAVVVMGNSPIVTRTLARNAFREAGVSWARDREVHVVLDHQTTSIGPHAFANSWIASLTIAQATGPELSIATLAAFVAAIARYERDIVQTIRCTLRALLDREKRDFVHFRTILSASNPEGVVNSNHMFMNCVKLTHVTLPHKSNSGADMRCAFQGCVSLKRVEACLQLTCSLQDGVVIVRKAAATNRR